MKSLVRLLFAAALLAVNLPPAAALGHLNHIELFDRTDQHTLPVYWHQGRAWVVGAPGHEYRVVLRNSSPDDVLAVVSVDGVNVVSGETAHPGQSGYVIDRGGRLDLDGWRKSLSQTAAFYFTPLGDSYAARTGRPDNIGVIGVALYRRKVEAVSALADGPWRESAQASGAPAVEAERRKDATAGKVQAPESAPLGTGHGRREPSNVRYTSFERATQEPAEQLAIYYDSYANLVARGVIRSQPWREPQPFPGRFVEDPPR